MPQRAPQPALIVDDDPDVCKMIETILQSAGMKALISSGIDRTVLAARRNRRATWRTDALSHANPTASSKRLLNGALLGSWGTFSTRTPHCGQHTRYSSMITVVRYSPHGKSRTSRSLASCAPLNFRPHPEQISFRFPGWRRTHKRKALAASSISCW